MPSKPPLVGMKTHFPFQVAICAWVDLLGYGAEIKKAHYNPLDPQAKAAVKRIRQFHQVVADHSLRDFPTLVMNDGATAYRDLSYRTRWTTYDFVQRSYRLFEDIQSMERNLGEPGARMVVAVGFRLRGRASQSSELRGRYVKSLISAVHDNKMSVDEAITRASKFRRNFDLIPQLQANFAFTKAYIAEQSGSKGGLGGPRFFLDDLTLDFGKLENNDVGVTEVIKWNAETYGLGATFLAVDRVRSAKQTEQRNGRTHNHGPPSFRNALEIARYLSGDQKVLEALRKAKKENS